MEEKTLLTRVQQKHDTEEHWILAVNFTPKVGEVIVYDPDENYNYSRIKIGDGVTKVNSLPFADEALETALMELINGIDKKVDTVSGLVGDIAVSEQINNAVAQKSQVQFIIWEADD